MMLNSDREAALHALTPQEASEAERLLDEIARNGNALLDPQGIESVASDHSRVQELLRSASQQSSADAVAAEQRAAFALIAMSVATGLAAAMVMWSRARLSRTRALAGAQLRAGQRLQVLLNDSPDILLVVQANGRISYRSDSSSNLLDASCGSLEDLVRLASPKEQASLRAHLRHTAVTGASKLFQLMSDDDRRWFDVRVSDLTEDELVGGHLLTIRDVTNEVRLRSELQLQATTDLLTGLPNRRLLQPRLDAASLELEAGASTMALITLDIDGFKAINDSFGHLAGDELLVQVAARLSKATRGDETLIRLGGDEFAVVISNLAESTAAEATANRILEVLDDPFQIEGRTEHVRTSIGVATTADPARVELLLGQADVALYEAKGLGGDRVVVFSDTLESSTSRRDQITWALRDADYDQEFRMVYQPIVKAESREIATLEALLRWTHPVLGEVRPDEFIPVAELTGEIVPLGNWVFEQVCKQLAEWTGAGMDDNVSVSVNVSPRQLVEVDFVPFAVGTAEAIGVDSSRLTIEVTESAALDQTGNARRKIEQLRVAGFRISIDDFGSGYSNLGQLLSVPFDIIKIDRSLLLTLSAMREQSGGDPSEACSIMEAIVSIAGVLDAPVVCEGVETEQQLASLRASGITHIQGYLTGRPAPPHEIAPLICTSVDLGTAITTT